MKSKKQVLGTETGKFCLDVAKLIIGGVILASIVKKDIDPILLISVGFIFVIVLTGLGLWLMAHYKDGDEDKNKSQDIKRKYYSRKNRRK